MIRNIIVPLDGSAFGEHALPWALSLARRTEATIHLAHVVAPVTTAHARLSGSLIEPYSEVVRRRYEKYLDSIEAQLNEIGTFSIQTWLLEGDVCDRLGSLAEELDAELILITTHGRGPMGRFWLGSVADRMVRTSPVPLFMVRPGLTPLDLKKDCTIKHALVPLDGSRLAEAILPHVVPLCQAWKAELTLARFVEPLHGQMQYQSSAGFAPLNPPMKEELDRMEKAHQEEASEYLREVVQKLESQNVSVHTHIACEDSPGPAVLKLAEEGDMNMIAMETHGRRGLPRFFMGSVADKVIRGTNNPILIHRPGGS